jgi:hypothetical protein
MIIPDEKIKNGLLIIIQCIDYDPLRPYDVVYDLVCGEVSFKLT